MMFLTLDDEFGLFEATYFPGRRGGEQFDSYGPYIVTGRVTEQYDTISITAKRLSHPSPPSASTRRAG